MQIRYRWKASRMMTSMLITNRQRAYKVSAHAKLISCAETSSSFTWCIIALIASVRVRGRVTLIMITKS